MMSLVLAEQSRNLYLYLESVFVFDSSPTKRTQNVHKMAAAKSCATRNIKI